MIIKFVIILGNDKGTQYASVIFCYDTIQADIAKKVINELQQHINNGKVTSYSGKVIRTDIRMATEFYEAHGAHQDYLSKNPRGYCNHRIRFPEWPQ